MRYLVLLLAGLTLAPAVRAQTTPIRLEIDPAGTHLRNRQTKAPFFYLADTAWELLHRCDENETRRYLSDRQAKGFNAIQTVVLAELEGLTTPNAKGDLPLENQDPTRPVEAYFQHVDRAAAVADSLNIFLALLPTWGDKFNKKWGVGPEVFTPENARTFAEFLGRRYRNNNIIWVLGGDRNPEEPEDFAIIRAMAAGLEATVGDEQLVTYHPQGGYKSSDFFAGEDWVDFHMFQTGHGALNDKHNYDYPREIHAADPGKPIINGEPAYEDHPINWRSDNGWFDDFDTRQAAYWSVLSGADGHTFGNHNIWQMWRPGREPISQARTDWHEAMYYPGAAQMGHLRALMESLPYYDLQPDWNLLNNPPNSSGMEVLVARTPDYSHVLAYTPYGHDLRIPKDKLPEGARFFWFDPRTGVQFRFTPADDDGMMVCRAPLDVKRGNDWVLVVRR